MLITYTHTAPPGAGPARLGGLPHDLGKKTFNFKPEKLMSAEAEAIEDVTDWTYQQFQQKFMLGSMKAWRAVLWVLLKREFPTLKHREVSFEAGAIMVDFDDQETADMRAAAIADPDLDDETREAILDALRDVPEDEAAKAADDGDEDGDPKDD